MRQNNIPMIKDNRVRLGFHKVKQFTEPDGNLAKFGSIEWFTSLSKISPSPIPLTATYKGNEGKYPHYDNYDAIEVGKVKEIPSDYKGYMGVPITFLDKYNPSQFHIQSANEIIINPKPTKIQHGIIKDKDGTINGKRKYARIVIRRLP